MNGSSNEELSEADIDVVEPTQSAQYPHIPVRQYVSQLAYGIVMAQAWQRRRSLWTVRYQVAAAADTSISSMSHTIAFSFTSARRNRRGGRRPPLTDVRLRPPSADTDHRPG